MAKLKGKAKAAFLRRMKAGRKAAKSVKKAIVKRRKSSKKSRNQQGIKTRKRTKKIVAKKGSRRSRVTSGFNKITGNKFVRGAVLGLGGAALVVQVTNRFAPQFSGLASPIGAFIFGGPVGLVASVLLQGGLGSLGSIFGQQGVDNGMRQSV